MREKFTYITAVLLISILFGCEDPSENIDSGTIEVDFAIPSSKKSMSGFLHGITSSSPPDSLIDPLAPKLLRSSSRIFSIYDRKLSFGARPIFMITDLWFAYSNGFETMPYDDYDEYREFLLGVIEDTRELDIIYDIRNEPEQTEGDFVFWKGTKEQFFETFKITHDVLRSELGDDVIISGPSTHWRPDYLDDFLRFSLENNIKLDVLSWHEFQASNDISQVATNLRQMRENYVDNPEFAPLGIQEIHINEYGFSDKHMIPAFALAYLYYLEEGKADGACRTCWDACWRKPIGDLLTDELEPRAVWWIYKYYAESHRSRVQSTTNQRFIVPFASLTPGEDSEARVLLANHYTFSIGNVSVILKNINEIPNLAEAKEVHVKLYKIPSTERLPLLEPQLIDEFTKPVVDNTISIERGALSNNDAYSIELFSSN